MTPPDASLATLLLLVEQWQHYDQSGSRYIDACRPLLLVDVPALRATAQQHAAALRDIATHHVKDLDESNEVRAVADFLQPEEPA